MSFRTLRSILMGKLARYRALGLSCLASSLGLLDFLLELHLLGYPPWTLRGLAHSLPNSAAVRSARESLRAWLHHRDSLAHLWGEMGGSSKGSKQDQGQRWESWWGPRGGSYRQWQPRDRDQGRTRDRDGDRDHSRRWRRDDSSSSSDDGRETRVDRARKYLTKHNDEYRQFVEGKAEKEKEEALRRQGEILAKAMEATFTQSLQQQVVQPLLACGQFPPTPPVVGGAAAGSISGASTEVPSAVPRPEPPSGLKSKDLS